MIKMIVTDMDGTLLCRHGLGELTVKVLKEANAKGMQFIVATGRDLSGITGFFRPYGIQFSAILGNGAQYINQNGDLIKSCYFPKQHFKEVVKVFNDYHLPFMIFCDDGFYSTEDPDWVCEEFIIRGMARSGKNREEVIADWGDVVIPCMHLKKIDDIDAFLESKTQIVKLEAFYYVPDPVVACKPNLNPIQDIAYLSSSNDNVEVTAKNAQKGIILESILDKLGVTKDEVAVFGDGLNDTTLFERFPHAYAVSNAEEAIKEMAEEVILSNEEEGVAKKIAQFLEEQY